MKAHVEIPLTQGYVALIDIDDYEVVRQTTWRAARKEQNVYALRHIRRSDATPRTTATMHTVLAGWPRVDHMNGDGLDNRRANLREATNAQNMANQRLSRRNTSGFKGVTWRKDKCRWQVQVGVAGRLKHLGYFDSAEEAARAYDAAAREYHGEFATLNFPLPGERPARPERNTQ